MVFFMNTSNLIEKDEESGTLVQVLSIEHLKRIMMQWFSLINTVLNFLGNMGFFALRSFISAVRIQ
jgi:hypothetical protein